MDRLQGGLSILCLFEVAEKELRQVTDGSIQGTVLFYQMIVLFRRRREQFSESIGWWPCPVWMWHSILYFRLRMWASETFVWNLLVCAHLVQVHCLSPPSPPFPTPQPTLWKISFVCLGKNSRWNKITPLRKKDGIVDIWWTHYFLHNSFF